MQKFNNQSLDIIIEKTKAHLVSDDQWSGYCPSHDDQTESLSIGISKESGNILLTCHAGCDFKQICASLEISQNDLFPKTKTGVSDHAIINKSVKDTYNYRDIDGNEIFQVVRLEPKDFRQRRLDDKGGWIWNTQGIDKPLFNLPELIAADTGKPIFIAEGEKDVLNLQAQGVTATCNVGGAGKWKSEYNEYFINKDVYILPNKDSIGQQHAESIASSLNGTERDIKIISLPDLPEKGDVSDWINMGHPVDELLEIAETTPIFYSRSIIRPYNIEEFFKLDFPTPKPILSPWLLESSLSMLYGPRGLGKTFLCNTLSHAVASGNDFLGWSTQTSRRVLLVDGEMPADMLQRRFAQIVSGFDNEPISNDYLKILSADMFESGIPDLASVKGQQVIEENLADIDFLVLDNLSTLFRRGTENDAESWSPIQEWILSLRRKHIAVLLVHHAGKTGQQRGTSKREDVLDSVISLQRPQDYKTEEGCRFEIHFEKARHLYGNEVASFEAQMAVTNDAALWTRRSAGPSEKDQVIAFSNDGMTQREIADELKISVGKVNKLVKNAKTQGKLSD